MIIENDSKGQMSFLMEDISIQRTDTLMHLQIPIDGQNANYGACNRSHLSRN